MKLKTGFVLQEVAGETVVLPVDSALDMNMMITLNHTATFLWQLLDQDTTAEALVEALLGEYDVDRPTAQSCVDNFVKELENNGFLA